MADYNKKSVQSIISRNRRIEKVLDIAFKDVSKRFKTVKGKRFTKVLKKEIEGLRASLKANIEKEVKQQWMLSNEKVDIMTEGYVQNIKVSDQLYKSFRSPNLAALNTFLNRVEKGMDLSKRIWKLTDNAQIQLEDFLASGVTVGKPAVQVAKELKRYMNGKGVQYKGTLLKARNITWEALRLATTEANMAFRLSEQTKMEKLPFVTGCSIHLSGAHPRIDICDELVGDYPKGFIWSGWHPVCICFRTWRKLPKKAFVQFMKTGQIPKEAFIQKLPPKMNIFMKKNVEKLGGYVKRGTEPYWMRDNFNKDLTVKMGVGDIKLPDMKLVIPKVPIIPRISELELTLQNNKITNIEPLKLEIKSRNVVEKVTLEGNVQGVFKAIEGEYIDTKRLLGGSSSIRERSAYRISTELGWKEVPETVIRTINGKKGSLQYWVKGDLGYDIPKMGQFPSNKMDFFDALLANPDRHGGNFLRTKNLDYKWIDNGGSLSSKQQYQDIYYRDEFVQSIKQMSILDAKELKINIGKLSNSEFLKLLEKEGLEREAIKAFSNRVRIAQEELEKFFK